MNNVTVDHEGSRSANGPSAARMPDGRFAPGNRGGPGNPHGKRVSQLRAMLLAEVDDNDLRQIARVLIEQAKGGNMAAVRELLDRTVGRAVQSDLLERLESIEALVHDHSKEAPQ